MKKMINEFKKFAIKGNVVDMGVGIIIGGAFGTVVKSLVDDVIMPPIGILTGGVDFSSLAWTLKQASDGAEAVTLNYGMFINNIIAFLIIAFAVFILVKQMNKVQEMFEKEEENSDEPKKTPEDIKLLTEIRDVLKSK
jgi:large conductance mechanosensitive channel